MVLPLGDSTRTWITPHVTYALIALNVLMFAAQLQRGETFTTAMAATPYEITHDEDIAAPFLLEAPPAPPGHRQAPDRVVPQGPVPFPVWFTLITAMFLHAGVLHLGGNLLFLWIFGDNVEEVLGHVRFLVVYLCCGLAASLAQIAAEPDSLIPTLGASGAISGVMGMYLIWFPYHRVRVLIFQFLTEVPAAVVIVVWLGIQLWQGVGSLQLLGQSGGVAYLAHLGGAAAGIVAGLLFEDDARQQGHTPITG